MPALAPPTPGAPAQTRSNRGPAPTPPSPATRTVPPRTAPLQTASQRTAIQRTAMQPTAPPQTALPRRNGLPPKTSNAKAEHEILFQRFFKSVGPRTYVAQVKKATNGN